MSDKLADVKIPTEPAVHVDVKSRQVRLRALRWEAPGVLSLHLNPVEDGSLPPFEPGAHIDLTLPDGACRKYSLCGNPEDTSYYRLGIRAIAGGLSSTFVHKVLRPGDLLTISAPRNNFPLVDAKHYIFVAGGIGITPLIPMMHRANANRRHWTLLYCNRRNQDAPFLDEIRDLGGNIFLYSSAPGPRLNVAERFSAVERDSAIYCCGPESLMSAVEASTTAWPRESVHFERFTPKARPSDEASGSFELVCHASGKTLLVPPDRSILQVLDQAGIDVPRSCEQGICGNCELRVLSGDVDHRDSILSTEERATNRTMMVCVSRSRGPRLVLDI
jgi:ferredoxin-NADP reductase